MAIHLISGVPGAGKSLRAVWTVTRMIEGKDQDRPVFGNVRGYKRQSPLPGSDIHMLDGSIDHTPGEWMDCPDGSIILIDEVQQRWRRYRSTGEPPPEIAALEMHRHRNIDFVLTCQNPKQLSDDVRSLVDVHEHLVKKGKGIATVWKWEGRAETTPHRAKKEADCEVSPWRYPKWVFQEYVSAVEHNVKKKIPRSVKIFAAALLAIPFGIAFAVMQVQDNLVPDADAGEIAASQQQAFRPPGAPISSSGQFDQVQPEPLQVKAAGGIRDETRCALYDQSGMRIDVTYPECINALEMGLPRFVTPL